MTWQQAEQQLTETLATLYDRAEAIAISNLAMEHLSQLSRSDRRLQALQSLSAPQIAQWETMQAALLQHKPIQYVIGEAWFYNMPFAVTEAVLIPRPETEELVQWVLEDNASRTTTRLLDIGTGSGCIPIAVKKNWAQAEVYALDVSENALEIARQNARKLGADIAFLKADILNEAQWPDMTFDIIVSNPPYIPQEESAMLDAHVTDWEPHLALFVPNNDPLLFYRQIAAFAETCLAHGGSLYLECHQHYAAAVVQLLHHAGFDTLLKKDLFDNARMVKAWRNKH